MIIQSLWSSNSSHGNNRISAVNPILTRSGSDETVSIRLGQSRGDPSIITINCPNQLGLACDLCRIILEFGLCVVRADFSTDGRWCLVIFWVTPVQDSYGHVRWAMLKKQLLGACPSYRALFCPTLEQKQADAYLLQLHSADRIGLLNEMLQTLWELGLTVHRLRSSISPDGTAINLFYIIDNKKMLQNKKREEEIGHRLRVASGDMSCFCHFQPAGPECGKLGCENLSVQTEELLNEGSPGWKTNLGSKNPQVASSQEVSVVVDNSLSPGHTLLQISCKDQRGLLYDVTRTLKDFNLQIAYGRISTTSKNAEIELFVVQEDGKKIVDPQKQENLCSVLKREILHPIRLMLVNKGPDTELLVATPVESCGYGRPQALFDVTLALRMLDVAIFKADSGRYTVGGSQWDVHRLLLTDKPELKLVNSDSRNCIAAKIRKIMIGY